MKKSIFIFAIISILFTGCKKWIDNPDSKEDLSYLIKTYERYESGGHVYKYTWTYDGYKATGYKYFVDGQLYLENKDYSYDGLNASWDSYSYRNGDANEVTVSHVECEYLDETFRRIRCRKTRNDSSGSISESYYEYDGKKPIGYKSYSNGILTAENRNYHYDGLHCSYEAISYLSNNVVYQKRSYDISYLDDTYLRIKTTRGTLNRYDTDGNLINSMTTYTVNDYDGKKPIGYHYFRDGKLSGIGRDYQYDCLSCYYFVDQYQEGEVVSTQIYEVEYLE